MKMTMKKLTAVCMATIVAMCSLALRSSGTGERNLLVHAASADDLTFEIVTLNKGQMPDFTSDKPYSDWKYYLPVNEELSSSEPYCFAVVTKCNKYAAGTLEIPAEYEGVPVKAIDTSAFAYECYDLNRIIVPESVEAIGSDAFSGCLGLAEISLPTHLRRIGNGAFNECRRLKKIMIPDGITSIGSGCFKGCKSLDSLSLPEKIKTIGSSAFHSCSSLKKLTVPNGVTEIGAYAFYDCSSMETLILPDSLSSIGQSFISGTTKLKSIILPKSIIETTDQMFHGSGLETITLQEGLLRILDYSFSACLNLKAITIPKSVTNIRKSAFLFCDSLESITILNPECALNDFGCKPQTIYGAWGSTAETFAAENGIAFRPLDDAPQPEVPETPALPEAPAGSVFGDVSGDRDITAADAQYVLLFYTEKITGKQPTWYQITGNPDSPV